MVSANPELLCPHRQQDMLRGVTVISNGFTPQEIDNFDEISPARIRTKACVTFRYDS